MFCSLSKYDVTAILLKDGSRVFGVLLIRDLRSYLVPTSSKVEVQAQIGLWSDPVQCTAVCSQTQITGSGKSSSLLQSVRWSGDGLIRGQIGLKSLIIRGFERTWVWSEAISSAIGSYHNPFECTLVWSEAPSSAIGFDHNLFERTWVWSEMLSNAIGSKQGSFRMPYFLFVFILLFFFVT